MSCCSLNCSLLEYTTAPPDVNNFLLTTPGDFPLINTDKGIYAHLEKSVRWWSFHSDGGHVLLLALSVVALSVTALLASAHAAGERPSVIPQGALSPNVVVSDAPYLTAVHSINELELAVSNRGVLGKPLRPQLFEEVDCFTGQIFRNGAIFPRGSRRNFLEAIDLWIGAQRVGGPKVSTGRFDWFQLGWYGEMLPPSPPGDIARRSTINRFGGPDSIAISEEDITCLYTDSSGLYSIVGHPLDTVHHDALGVTVTQVSSGWSIQYAEDFIIVDLRIRNTGRETLNKVYVGLHILPDANLAHPFRPHCQFAGFITRLSRSFASVFGCGFRDSLDLAWHAQRSGSPHAGQWQREISYDPLDLCYQGSTRGALGVLPLRMPHEGLVLRYNWWGNLYWDHVYVEATKDPSIPAYRDSPYHLSSDKERYRMLSAAEADYPSYFAAEVATSVYTEWNRLPLDAANGTALSLVPEMLLSWGPLTLRAGAEIPFTFAVVGGENVHVDVDNYHNLPQQPGAYEAGLDLSDLAANARSAACVYDNPGVDTDGDGYFGEFRVCLRDSTLVNGNWVTGGADTQWYKGDGIPDFQASLPPPAPVVWVTPTFRGLRVRFNGAVSESSKDIFLQQPDFEGYRVYLGRDERESSLSLVASYDREDYDKFVLDIAAEVPTWRQSRVPLTSRQLRCLYGSGPDPCSDSTFDPLAYDRFHPFKHPAFPDDSLFYFTKHEFNASEWGRTTPITKRFPDVPDPRRLSPADLTPDMYTDDGYLKFFEYEVTVNNLLPTVAYYVGVTAFDYGSPAMGLVPLESERTAGLIEAFPAHERDAAVTGSNRVYVYPNPYRGDANYRALGYEGRNQDDRWDERVRSIWFANLPPRCTITIFTLDGDRVRTLEHDIPADDPAVTHHRWDLINRNMQMVESGLYYWTVQTPNGETQIGKLVIVR